MGVEEVGENNKVLSLQISLSLLPPPRVGLGEVGTRSVSLLDQLLFTCILIRVSTNKRNSCGGKTSPICNIAMTAARRIAEHNDQLNQFNSAMELSDEKKSPSSSTSSSFYVCSLNEGLKGAMVFALPNRQARN